MNSVARYVKPRTLDDALAALAADARAAPADRLAVLAGATDFYPAATARQAWFQPTPQHVLDICGVASLRGITRTAEGFRIGALATWSDVIAADLPPAFDGLKQASRQVGGVQIQNRGTLAGNLCNASPAADGAPPLLALDAEVEISSAVGTRQIPLAAFTLGNRKTALEPGEMVTAIHVPAISAQERSVFLKLGARSYLVISIASVAANLALDDAGCIKSARFAVGACAAVALRLTALEQAVLGLRPHQAAALAHATHLAHLSPLDDVRATADYRRAAALTLVRRALAALGSVQERAA
jgi:CO/xanthine dehydrogenase FAD-binding subunit